MPESMLYEYVLNAHVNSCILEVCSKHCDDLIYFFATLARGIELDKHYAYTWLLLWHLGLSYDVKRT